MSEQKMTEQESLQLITEMIQKAKGSFHERGSSSILWGSVVALCGLLSFAQMHWRFYIGFDVWLLTLLAFVPQLFIAMQEGRRRIVRSHTDAVLNHVWLAYGVSVFALVFYFNIVPGVTDRLLLQEGVQVFEKNSATGIEKPFRYFVASSGSLLLLLYAIPTLITGLSYRFRPMIVGAVLCYGFFALSLFTETRWDMLCNGLAAIGNWLLPGLILRRRYLQAKAMQHV